MDVWEIVLLAIVAVLALLFVGGFVGNARVTARRERRLRERIAAADTALAEARATDRGWDRERLEATVRAVLDTRRPGVRIERLDLVQVVDLPGTDRDSAVFRVVRADGEERLELVRSGDDWCAA